MDARRVSGVIGLLLAAGVIAGCSASGGGSTSSAGLAADAKGGAAEAPAAGGAGKPGAPNQAPNQAQVNQPGVDRKLIRTATLELGAPNVVELTNKARDVAVGLGGFAGQEEVKGDSATLTLHIPSNQFDKALKELSELVPPEGVRSRTQNAEDVTEQLVDVESRIATQRTSVDRVRALMAKAQSVNEIVQIETEVTRREADLESLEKRREALTGQVAMSKVTIRVSKTDQPAPPSPAKDESGGFLTGLAGGWDAFLTAGGGLLQVLGAVLPFLIALGIPGGLVIWWRRRRRQLAPATRP